MAPIVRWLFLFGGAVFTLGVQARALASPSLRATRAAEAPVLDGRLDDAVWANTEVARAFTQKFPLEGAPASEPTLVRVLYDEHAVYIGVHCEQRDAPLALRLGRRDREVEADRIAVSISSRADKRSAFEFGVTASGVLSDGIYFDDGSYSRDWDENWEAEVAQVAGGWSAELRIPLRILRFDAGRVQTWGFNVSRFISARQELAEWSLVPRSSSGVVSRYGTLDNLVGIERTRPVELRPFVVGEWTHLGQGFGPQVGPDQRVSAGLDAKAHLWGDMTLDVAVNPDFGQVEADEVVLNLGTLETALPEKRPFFQEGTDLIPRRVLYTRRIGAVPGSPAGLDDESLVERPQPAAIWGAFKMTGRPAPWLGLAALSAVVGGERLGVRRTDGVVEDRVAAPLSAFQVLRLRGELPNGANLGFVASGVLRAEDRAAYPLVQEPGTPALALCPNGAEVAPGSRCFRDAYVAGFDGRWRSPSLDYSLTGTAMASLVTGGPPRPQRDGEVVRSGSFGPIGSLVLAKQGGEHWVWDAGIQLTGREADTNDLGFQERQNEIRSFWNTAFRTTRPWGPTLETHTGVQIFQQTNLDRLVLTRLLQLSSRAKLTSFWEIEAGLVLSPAAFDDREVGDGAALEHPRRTGGRIGVTSDPRRAVFGGLGLRGEWLDGGGRFSAGGQLRLRLDPRLDFDIEPEVTHRSGEPRFLEKQTTGAATRYLFGELTATSVGAVVRLTWTFTPRLTLQTYAQIFLLARRYQDFTDFTSAGGRSLIHLRDLAPAAAPPDDPDRREGIFNANVLLRWEYRLGSTFFLVYARSQKPLTRAIAPGDMGLDLGNLHDGPAANTFLLKWATWWG